MVGRRIQNVICLYLLGKVANSFTHQSYRNPSGEFAEPGSSDRIVDIVDIPGGMLECTFVLLIAFGNDKKGP